MAANSPLKSSPLKTLERIYKNSPLERIYRKDELPIFTGLKFTAIEKLIAEGRFPRGLALNNVGNARGWTEQELLTWQRQWIRERRAAAKQLAEQRRIYSMPSVEDDAA
jgi:predicted DNA-binding transcriptional regulator AlpA